VSDVYLAVKAELVRDASHYRWLVMECPWCGRQHVHGGGPITGDPRTRLCYQRSWCAAKYEETLSAAKKLKCHRDGYILVEEDPSESEKLIAEVAKTRAVGTHKEGVKS
jgi:hypothetical protein